MLQYHGWIMAIDSSDDDSDIQTDPTQHLAEDVRARFAGLASGNPVIELRFLNGALHIAVAAFHNRRLSDFDEVRSLYEYIAARAPDSYGLLHARDDDDPAGWENRFRVWALARGAFVERQDTHLSPCVPVIEDQS